MVSHSTSQLLICIVHTHQHTHTHTKACKRAPIPLSMCVCVCVHRRSALRVCDLCVRARTCARALIVWGLVCMYAYTRICASHSLSLSLSVSLSRSACGCVCVCRCARAPNLSDFCFFLAVYGWRLCTWQGKSLSKISIIFRCVCRERGRNGGWGGVERTTTMPTPGHGAILQPTPAAGQSA